MEKYTFFTFLITVSEKWERIINKQIIVIHCISFCLIIADKILIVRIGVVLPIRVRHIVLLTLLNILRIAILIHLIALLIIWIYSSRHPRIHSWSHSRSHARAYSWAHPSAHSRGRIRIGIISIWIVWITHRMIRISWIKLAATLIWWSTWCTRIHRIVIHRVIWWVSIKSLGEFLLWNAYHWGWLRVRSWYTWISLIVNKSTIIYFTTSLWAW